MLLTITMFFDEASVSSLTEAAYHIKDASILMEQCLTRRILIARKVQFVVHEQFSLQNLSMVYYCVRFHY